MKSLVSPPWWISTSSAVGSVFLVLIPAGWGLTLQGDGVGWESGMNCAFPWLPQTHTQGLERIGSDFFLACGSLRQWCPWWNRCCVYQSARFLFAYLFFLSSQFYILKIFKLMEKLGQDILNLIFICNQNNISTQFKKPDRNETLIMKRAVSASSPHPCSLSFSQPLSTPSTLFIFSLIN